MSIKASFIIPTLNEEKKLPLCLGSIKKQSYKDFEILLIDGGSSDKTLEIARKYSKTINLKILKNPAVDAESGKRIGIKKAKGEIIVLLDADNRIIGKNWLKTAMKAFDKHPKIWGVESPWLVNKKDPLLNQYFAMLKIADPIARVFSPSYKNYISKNYKNYDLIQVDKKSTPIIGANGFFYRKSLVKTEITKTNKFEEVNYVAKLISSGHQRYAILKNSGIYHDYCNKLLRYFKKRTKIAKKFLKRKEIKQETWVDKVGQFKFWLAVIYNASIIGPSIETIYQIYITKNVAWIYHPLVSFITVSVYGFYFIKFKIGKNES